MASGQKIPEVFPEAWIAILVSLDNTGAWNLRTENLDQWYLGQETYLRFVNPEENGDTEKATPDNVLYSGPLKQQCHSSEVHSFGVNLKHYMMMMLALFIAIFIAS
ncbi:hypothetical protein K1719_036443 [Acacia pycnantha]|nr:hypothetical protein K1719_036443 [Acacia pycnantha]